MTPNSLDIVIRFSSLGDLVLCAGFLEKLQHQRNGSRTVFATQKSFGDMVGSFQCPPQLIWGLPNSSLAVFVATWSYLKNEHARKPLTSLQVFDLHGVPKSFFFRAAARVFSLVNNVSYRSQKTPKKSFLRWLTLLLKKDMLGARHIYAEHQKLLAPANEIFMPRLRKPERDSSLPAPTQNILVAPDSQHWKKKWPVTYWEEFFRLAFIQFPQAEFTLVGGQDIFPMDLLDQLRDSFGPRFKNRLGQLPLSDLGRIASEHQLTLCGNSAWQHISEAVGVPVISIPGPIVRGFGFSPFLPHSRELEVQLTCRPCTRHGGGVCHRTGDDFHACMKRISPEIMIKNTKEMLSL